MATSNINVKISATDNATAQVTAVNNSISELNVKILNLAQGYIRTIKFKKTKANTAKYRYLNFRYFVLKSFARFLLI